ncbi:MAG: hypothetical protein RLZ37_2013, partial [Actinomycetota bacterium]
MKTRTLLLLSVGCGLLILLAGGLKLFQVSSDRTEVPVLELGATALIGDMSVSVVSIADGPDGTRVVVRMAGVAGETVVEDWRLLGDGRVFEPSGAEIGLAAGAENDLQAGAENGLAAGAEDDSQEDSPELGICGRSSEVPAGEEPIECVIRFPSVDAVQAVAYTR